AQFCTETHRADAAGSAGPQHEPPRAGRDGVSHGDASAAAPILARRHAQRLGGTLVEAAAGIESGAIDGFGDGPSRAQFRAYSSGPVRGGILSWRDTDHVFENAMEMTAAQSDRFGQGIQRGKRLRSFDDATRLCRSLRMSLPLRGAGRPAALAGSKSGALGIGAGVMKRDVFAKRQPRRTCWSAINAGRGHG